MEARLTRRGVGFARLVVAFLGAKILLECVRKFYGSSCPLLFLVYGVLLVIRRVT